MKIVETIAEVREQVKQWKKEGLTVALVPTMGYLHEGHRSLMERARKENDRVVVSVFVNPTQFGPNEDLASYPRDLEHDAALVPIPSGVRVWIFPKPLHRRQMYPKGFCSFVDMDVLTKELCGLSRPVHFRGVCTVVSKLFHIVTPDRAYFGEKDAQQLAVIKRMVLDLNLDIEIVGCPLSVRQMVLPRVPEIPTSVRRNARLRWYSAGASLPERSWRSPAKRMRTSWCRR